MSDSFLVRCWREHREVADPDQPDVVRVYVRNLRTGEEHYLNEASRVGELIERGLRPLGDEATAADDGRRLDVG